LVAERVELLERPEHRLLVEVVSVCGTPAQAACRAGGPFVHGPEQLGQPHPAGIGFAGVHLAPHLHKTLSRTFTGKTPGRAGKVAGTLAWPTGAGERRFRRREYVHRLLRNALEREPARSVLVGAGSSARVHPT